MFKILLVLNCIVVASRALDYRIAGGEPVDIAKHPYQAALVNFHNKLHCGACVIGARWLLTAAHCLENESWTRLNARVGSNYTNKGGQLLKLAYGKIHAKTNVTLDMDFAILKLQTPIQFNDQVQPVSLPLPNENVAVGTTAVVTGWGDTQPYIGYSVPTYKDDDDDNDHLRGVWVEIANDAHCKAQYSYFTKNMICASAPGKDSCQGDSGGPLVANGTLVGVVSFGIGCADPRFAGVYARVAMVRTWITQNTGI